MTYSEKLKDPRWQKKRLEIMQSDEFKCRICGDTETTLAVHHLKYSGDPWNASDDKLITVCEHCHENIELLKDSILDISTLKIIKKLHDKGDYLSRTEFIFYDSNIELLVYDNHKHNVLNLSFTKETAIKISELFLKYMPKE